MTGTLDPDELAELERERDHLLRSIDDLDAEHAVGDLSDDDHRTLVDDYTRRAAEVLRAIDERRSAFADRPRTGNRQRFLTVAGVVVVAAIAGLLLAQASGFRAPLDEATGDIRRSSAALLAEADTLTREGDWERAIEVYDEVIDLAPGNVEALTYRGWLTSRLGDDATGLDFVLEAVAVDPEYPDARVFAAALLDGSQRFDEAAEQLRALDDLEDVNPQIEGLVTQFGLRRSVVAGQLAERFRDGSPVDLDGLDASLDEVTAGAAALYAVDPVTAVRVLDAVLEVEPENLTALLTKGTTLAGDPRVRAESPEAADAGLALLDEAVRVAPDLAEARLARAQGRFVSGDVAGAGVDLAEIDADELPPEILPVYDELVAAVG